MNELRVKVCNSYCYECNLLYDEENFGSHHKRIKLEDEQDSDFDITSHENVDEMETTEVEPLRGINDIPTTASTSQSQDTEIKSEDVDEGKQKNPGMMISIPCSHKESFSHTIYVTPRVGNSTTSTSTPPSILNISKLKSYMHCSKCYETFSQISVLIEHFEKCNVERDVTLKEWKDSQLNFKDASTSTPTTTTKDASMVTAPIKVAVVNNGSMTVLRFGEKEIPIPHLVPRIESNLKITKYNLVNQYQQTEEQGSLPSQLQNHNNEDITNNNNIDDAPSSPSLNINSKVDQVNFLVENFPVTNEIIAVEMEDGKFKCSECSKVFTSKYHCRDHFVIHQGEKLYKCQFCDHRCNFRKTLLSHLKNKHKHEDEEYKCFRFLDNTCDLTFPTIKELQDHMKCHPTIKKVPQKREKLPCSKCGKKISSAHQTLQKHEEECTYGNRSEEEESDEDADELFSSPPPPPRVKKFTCTGAKCSRTFWTRLDLNRHLIKVHELLPLEYERKRDKEMEKYAVLVNGKKRFKCPDCLTMVYSGRYLKNHMVHHNQNSEMEKYAVDVNGKKQYKCPDCPIMLDRIQSLKNHMTHHNQNGIVEKFVCSVEECGKEFASAYSLTQHTKKVHEGIVEDFLCSFCGACLHNRNSYRQHLASHSEEKPYKCTFDGCDKAFYSKVLLGSHQLSHTRNFKFFCKFCKKPFRSNYVVRLHELTHTKDHAYKCKFCDSSFRHMAPLKRHVRTTHADADGLDLQNSQTYRL